jgi:uncharacterized protein (DUF433 family)
LQKTKVNTLPLIVITEDILWGQPRLDGRRLAVGDIVCMVGNNDGPQYLIEDFEVNLEQINQALSYCSQQKCLDDKPAKYCHNCTLRCKEDNEEPDEERDNWIWARELIQQYL